MKNKKTIIVIFKPQKMRTTNQVSVVIFDSEKKLESVRKITLANKKIETLEGRTVDLVEKLKKSKKYKVIPESTSEEIELAFVSNLEKTEVFTKIKEMTRFKRKESDLSALKGIIKLASAIKE